MITLRDAAVIPADETLDLDPKFFDGYGNSIEDIELNWTVDGIDSTLQPRLSDAIWYPETIEVTRHFTMQMGFLHLFD